MRFEKAARDDCEGLYSSREGCVRGVRVGWGCFGCFMRLSRNSLSRLGNAGLSFGAREPIDVSRGLLSRRGGGCGGGDWGRLRGVCSRKGVIFLDEVDCCWSSNFKMRWNPSLSSLDLSLAESGGGAAGVGGSCGLVSTLGPKNPVNFEGLP